MLVYPAPDPRRIGGSEHLGGIRRRVDLAEQDVQMYGDLVKLARIREAAGKVANLDVVEASANLNDALSQVPKMQALYSEARRNLEVLIGR